MTAPVMIESKMGPISEVRTPWRWLCQPMTSGIIQGEIIPAWVLPAFAGAMVGKPVRWVLVDGHLVHPSFAVDPTHPAHRVGEIEAAWVEGDHRAGVVRAVVRLDPDAGRLQRALITMHAKGQLRRLLGVSMFAKVERAVDPRYPATPYVAGVKDVIALDFGTTPGNPEARLLRPLRRHELMTMPAARAPEAQEDVP